MGIMSNTVTICQFRVKGELEALHGAFATAHELLTDQGFQPIDESAEELSSGWVQLDDPKANTFSDPSTCWRDGYLVFSLRRDQRKIPTALLKEQVDKACEAFLAEHPNLHRVSKEKRNEIKDAVRLKLLAKALPDPKVYDVVWNTETGILTFSTVSPKVVEILEDHFKRTFDGLRLAPIIPYHRAHDLLSGHYFVALEQANKAGGDNYLELLKENEWIGRDLLYWLFYQTLNGDSEYRVSADGPKVNGEQFIGYINDKVVLVGDGEGGRQMITVSGPQDRFNEVRSALQGRKAICEATIHLEMPEESYCLTLKGGEFHFTGFSTPAVKLEKDNTVDERLEREAVFFERMALLDTGLQLFNSLFRAFLHVRLGLEWGVIQRDIAEWVESA